MNSNDYFYYEKIQFSIMQIFHKRKFVNFDILLRLRFIVLIFDN